METEMLRFNYDYATCVKNSERSSWRVDEVMPADTRLDFSRPFLPEALVPNSALDFLSSEERLMLNQISGNAYLNLFAFVEEYILVTVVQHAQAEMFGDRDAIRALVRFADEEVKHQRLFERYRAAFDRDFASPAEVLESAAEVAQVILSKSPIAVMLITLHIELMTQHHYTECVKDDRELDPLFASILKHHWLEESQHAKIDALELAKLVAMATPTAIDKAFDDYLDILGAFDGLLAQQAQMDVRSLGRATGRVTDADGTGFGAEESERIRRTQLQGYRRTFVWYGMTSPMFVDALEQMSPEGAARVTARVPHFS
ncbi:MAG: diiron oxygenase [Myxococcales bacterium]|nr:diiron oxygenase [Myxococcales bacterium]